MLKAARTFLPNPERGPGGIVQVSPLRKLKRDIFTVSRALHVLQTKEEEEVKLPAARTHVGGTHVGLQMEK